MKAPLWMLALITLSGTLAMHIFVPALPQAARDLGVSNAAMQLTLSAYVVGLALGQLTHGPISDQYGRRPVLIAGMILYTAAGLAAWLAPTIQMLTAARLLQAFGGCAGMVLGRAIVRDQVAGNLKAGNLKAGDASAGVDAARRLSLMNLMVMAGPGLSPLLGTALAEATGWRSIFAALCLLGLGNLLLVWRWLPETVRRETEGRRLALGSYRFLLRSRPFLGFVIGGGAATTSVYAFIGAAPFIFVDQLHRPAHEVGLYLTINVLGAWFGSLAASRLVGQVAMRRLMTLANLLSCAAALVFLLFVLAGTLGVVSALASMLVLTFGAGIASPTALAESMAVNPAAAGTASGLYGFSQMAIGAICAALAGVGSDPSLAVGIVLLGAGLLAQAAFWVARRPASRPTAG